MLAKDNREIFADRAAGIGLAKVNDGPGMRHSKCAVYRHSQAGNGPTRAAQRVVLLLNAIVFCQAPIVSTGGSQATCF
jgi:hypothetical protein